MKYTLHVVLMGFTILALSGCGGGGSGSGTQQSSYTTTILSDPTVDGDIEQTQTSYIVTQGMSPSVQSVFAGVDPVSLNESRAFLDFPLGGSGGIPYNAVIDSASLNIFINDVQPSPTTVPILIDLVSFQPLILQDTDFDRTLQPPLVILDSVPIISSADTLHDRTIDVTNLMVEAQSLGLTDFQVRILEDFGSAAGFIEINDSTGANRPSLAPLLTVTYH